MFSDLHGVGVDAVSVDAVTVHADHSLLTACLYVWVTTDSIACLLESMTFACAALDKSQRKDKTSFTRCKWVQLSLNAAYH